MTGSSVDDPGRIPVALQATQRSSLVTQVIEQLQEQVGNGGWRVDERIPPENMLAETLGVGRNTVREAVRALCHTGLLECRQGDGTYVRATSELSGAMRRRLSSAELVETLEVRQGLEVTAARLAATRRTDADLATIRAALHARDDAWRSGDTVAFVDGDMAFHIAVVGAAHNGVLSEIYTDFSAALRASIAATGSPVENSYIGHSEIADAIAAGDAEAAERHVRTCIAALIAHARGRS
jgi:DNA-binding FadR family transcriptional regulator